MRRLAIGLGAVAAIAALIVALVPWTLSGRVIRRQFVAQVRKTTGLVAELPARVTFSLLPRPHVRLENLSIHDERGGLSISAALAKGDLRLIALATGKIELSSITLFQPRIVVDVDRSPSRSTGAIARARAAAPQSAEAASADSARLAGLRIEAGEITLRSPSRRFETTIDDVHAKLDWRLLGSPASLTASGEWRGRAASVTAWVGAPAALLRGGSSPANLSTDADLLSARFDGVIQSGPAWRFDGQTSATSPAIPALASWLGRLRLLPAFGAGALSGRMIADAQGLTFMDMALSLAGSDFEGDAALRIAGARPVLSATLASDTLTLTPYVSDLPPFIDEDGSWSDAPLSGDFGPLDLDLRISAARAKLQHVELTDLGVAILLENDRLDLSLPEAHAYGGTLNGHAALTRAPGGETLSASASFENVESGALLWDAAACDILNGPASGQFSIDTRGASTADLVRGLSGNAKFLVDGGEIVGVDFEQALRRVEKRPLSVAEEVHGGRTPFDKLSGKLAFGDDKATLDGVELSGPGARVDLSGATLLGERALDIKAVAQQAGDDGAPSADGSHLTVRIEGYWDDPRLVLDVESLVRSSEAAAPLFAPAAAGAPQRQ